MPFWGAILNKSTKQDQMESINRSDFAALDIIQKVLKVYETDPSLSGYENALWAISMIKHEVEQTGRTL